MTGERAHSGGMTIMPPTYESLGSVSFHQDIPGVHRFLHASAKLFPPSPFHIAVHHYSGVSARSETEPFLYAQLHAHNCWEIDILIPADDEFAFKIEADGEVIVVRDRRTVFIPPGTKHRMEVIAGRGTLICVIGAGNYEQSLA